MATQMRPGDPSHLFGAAADAESLRELRRLDLQVLEEGYIGGLNGVLLGVAAESGLRGACLLGEMPQVFTQLPYPKAALAVLETFDQIAGLRIDLAELREQAEAMDSKLDELLTQIEQAMGQQETDGDETPAAPEPEVPKLDPEDERRIERLFGEARKNRSKAYELKRELDRLGVFREYEDRFLDLFKKP